MTNYEELQSIIKNLDIYEIQYLIGFAKEKIKNIMETDKYRKEGDLIKALEISERRFSNGLKCPKCGSKNLNKNGISNHKQRYICKDCRKTFDKMTNSPLSSTKLTMDIWLNYCKFMLMGGSIRYCAKQLSISIPTSFYMRHRILDILNKELSKVTLSGVIQINQYLIEESFKGQKNQPFKRQLYREYNYYDSNLTIARRLFHINYKGKICIQTAIDKNNNILSRVVSRESPTKEDICKFFENKIKNNVIFCTPICSKLFHLKAFRNKAENVKVNIFRYKNIPAYNVNKVNSYFREFDNWFKQFRGVASKYLNNYLAWFKLINICKNKFKFAAIKDLFLNFVGTDIKLTQKDIKNRKIDLLY